MATATPPMNGVSKSSARESPPPYSLPVPSAAGRHKTTPQARPKTGTEPKSAIAMPDANIAARHAHDRLLYLMAAFVGHQATLTTATNDQYTGIFSAASLEGSDNNIVLKMTKRLSRAPREATNGVDVAQDSYVGYGDDHVMVFDLKDVGSLEVPGVVTDKVQSKLTNGSSFRTDADISGNLDIRERRLEAWQDETPMPATDVSMTGKGVGAWDQFAENHRRFGLTTDYDDEMYTTAIDRSASSYKARAARADKLAREIENSEASNSHVAEERNLFFPEAENMDEESKYSGVARPGFAPLTSANANRYTPPARRPPTGQPTVAGAPVDPVIISSVLAQPDSVPQATLPTSSPAPPLVSKENDKAPGDVVRTTVALPQVMGNTASTVNQQGSKGAAPASTATASASDATPLKPTLPSGKTTVSSAAPTATSTIEHDVVTSFKNWASSEKNSIDAASQKRKEEKVRKDRADKFADLKKFSANFKLKTVPPHDILGILARDKVKQQEIERKAEEERLKATAAAAATTSTPTATPAALAAPVAPTPAAVPAIPTAPANNTSAPASNPQLQQPVTNSFADRGQGSRRGPPFQQSQPQNHHQYQQQQQQQQSFQQNNRHGQSSTNGQPGRVTGQLGQRLLAHQQSNGRGYVTGGFVNGGFPMPNDARNFPQQPQSTNGRTLSVASQLSATSPFNVKAMEFKPNPAASSFQPGDAKNGIASPVSTRAASAVSPERPVDRVSFFGDKKPDSSKKKSIRDAFNPIARMQKETEASGKTKDYAANGGLPKAFATRLTWDDGKDVDIDVESEDKGYVAMATKTSMAAVAPPSNPFPFVAQQPMPPQVQHNQHYLGNQRNPSYRGQGGGHGRDYYDERMQHVGSQHSSVHPSPSMRPPMLAQQQGQMGMHNFQPQAMFGQPGMQGGRPYQHYMGPNPNFHVAPPMMGSHSNQGQFIPVMPGMNPAMFQQNGYGMPGPGMPGNFAQSPRQAQMMMNTGSNHSQMPPQYPQQGGPYMPNPQMNMRGGIPMMQQGSFGNHQMNSNRGQHQFGNSFQGGMPPQQMQQHHNPMMGHPAQ